MEPQPPPPRLSWRAETGRRGEARPHGGPSPERPLLGNKAHYMQGGGGMTHYSTLGGGEAGGGDTQRQTGQAIVQALCLSTPKQFVLREPPPALPPSWRMALVCREGPGDERAGKNRPLSLHRLARLFPRDPISANYRAERGVRREPPERPTEAPSRHPKRGERGSCLETGLPAASGLVVTPLRMATAGSKENKSPLPN